MAQKQIRARHCLALNPLILLFLIEWRPHSSVWCAGSFRTCLSGLVAMTMMMRYIHGRVHTHTHIYTNTHGMILKNHSSVLLLLLFPLPGPLSPPSIWWSLQGPAHLYPLSTFPQGSPAPSLPGRGFTTLCDRYSSWEPSTIPDKISVCVAWQGAPGVLVVSLLKKIKEIRDKNNKNGSKLNE